jgi:asparagine synthetase A
MEGKLPQSMGLGLDQSRPRMFYLRTSQSGEVAVVICLPEVEAACARANTYLL